MAPLPECKAGWSPEFLVRKPENHRRGGGGVSFYVASPDS